MPQKDKKDNRIATATHGNLHDRFDIERLRLFGDNHACAHAYKRTERILIALHLVTNFVPEAEPARRLIRDRSVRILSDILALRAGFHAAGLPAVESVVASICEVTSLLDILHAAGFISDMNHEVLRRELGGLVLFLQEIKDTGASEKVTFTSDDFEKDTTSYKGHTVKDTKMSVTSTPRKGQKQRGDARDVGASRTTDAGAAHAARKNAIINLVKDKAHVTVKDVAQVISDCSEKTIQRELLAMVAEGVLKKEGERRWSTYSLA